VNKAELVQELASRFEGNKRQAQDALETVVDTITRAVAKGERVVITGFGAFEKVDRPARFARNPRTGEKVRVKKTAVPKFRPGADFRGYVSGSKKLPKLTASKTSATAKTAAKAPATKAPATKAPATKAPATKAPATKAPATKAPATKAAPAKTVATKAGTAQTAAKKAASPSRATTGTNAPAAAKKTSTAKAAPAARKAATKRATKKA
jgi:DNA-binding protein HU-beta